MFQRLAATVPRLSRRAFAEFRRTLVPASSSGLRYPGAATVAVATGSAAAFVLDSPWRSSALPHCSTVQTSGGRFDGAVVVITGGGGNIGRAGAEFMKREGAHVVILDAVEKPLKETEAALAKIPGRRSLAKVCDVTSDASVEAAVAAVEASFGKITHLWNNAGYQGAIKMSHEYPVDDFQKVMDINVVGVFRVAKAVANSMRKTGGGVIVNTASVAGLRGTPAMPAYVASKSAVMGLTMTLAKDLAPYNIRVNAVSPALIGPGYMWDRQNELHAASGSPHFARDPAAVAKAKIGGVAMKRVGSIEEVVKSTAFLLSEDSSYCTGTNLIVDGGLAMR